MSPSPHRKIAGQRPISARSLPPEQRARHSANGGKVAHLRKEQPETPEERWKAALPGVLKRFKADMKTRYADEDDQ